MVPQRKGVSTQSVPFGLVEKKRMGEQTTGFAFFDVRLAFLSMAYRTSLIFFGFLFLSAGTGAYRADLVEGQRAAPQDLSNPPDTLVPFSGSWINEGYLKRIRMTRSPRQAQDGARFVVIPEKANRLAFFVYNFHEGGTSFRVRKMGNAFRLEEDPAESETPGTRRYLPFQMLGKNRIRIEDTVFVKQDILHRGLNPLVLEGILFQGKYRLLNGKGVQLLPDGRIEGWELFSFYSPVLDYFDAGLQVDQVYLGADEKSARPFGFRFRGDTLCLHALRCLAFDSSENRCMEVALGKEMHRLIPQR